LRVLWIDFETRSRVDLGAKGVYNYAQDMSTEVLCMSYAFDDGEVVTWLPGQPFPPEIAQHTGLIYAHNAAFERLIFWYVLGQNFKLEQFYCTATQARANCAPGGLEDVGRFAGASMKKDHRGSQLIRLLSIPRADGTFNDDPALMAEMVAYCARCPPRSWPITMSPSASTTGACWSMCRWLRPRCATRRTNSSRSKSASQN
jgi:hypothetical protein